jgi:hypothetical protein
MDNNSDHDAVGEYVGSLIKGQMRKSADELAYRYAGPLGPAVIETAVAAYHKLTDEDGDK